MSTIPVVLQNAHPGAVAATYTTASVTPAANTRAIVFGTCYKNSLMASKPTISDSLGTITWTELGNVHTSNATNPDLWTVVWISNDLGPTPAAMTVTVAATAASGTTCSIITVLSADTDGTALQVASGEDLTAGDPSFTFVFVPGANNIVLGCNWHGGGNSITKPTGYTNLFDSTPTNLTARRVEIFYDNTSAAQGPNATVSTNIRSTVIAVELAPAPTGTNTPVGLAVTVTTTSSLAKLAGKIASVVVTATGIVKRAATKLLNVTSTTTGSLLKASSKSLANTVTTTSSLVKRVNKAVAAVATTIGDLAVGKIAVAREFQRNFLATVTTTSITKLGVSKSLSTVVTTSRVLAKVTAKKFAVVVTTTASGVRSTAKAILLATATTTASVSKALGKVALLANVVTTSVVNASTGTLYPIILAVTVTTTGSVKRGIVRSLTAGVTTLASLTKSVSKTIAASVTLAVVLKQAAHVLFLPLTFRLITAQEDLRKVYALVTPRLIQTYEDRRIIYTALEDDTIVSEN